MLLCKIFDKIFVTLFVIYFRTASRISVIVNLQRKVSTVGSIVRNVAILTFELYPPQYKFECRFIMVIELS